ncbi:hypothetical protein MTO96_049789 [Rhipicephalus appendiculatus]
MQSDGLVFIRAQCYRSKKKNASPYIVHAAIGRHGQVTGGNCECPAGQLACNHLLSMLRTVALLQSKGFSEAPEDITCTDLPQQWRVPRGNAIKGTSVQGIAWRSCHFSPSHLVPTPDLFKDVELWLPATRQTSSGILEKVKTTQESSLALERDTRQQSRSTTWQKERALRLTASNFGVVLVRQQWSSKGLQAITASRDLSRVAPIRYGISNEPMAAKRYEEVLENMGHDVTVVHCGLLVNPAFPWLGASPHRLVYDPAEGVYGVLEIKCPYSLREKKGDELANASFCSDLTESGPRLKREHYYYAQVVGQMGVSGLSWGDFVVYGKDFILIERIQLDKAEWDGIRDQLNYFHFNTLLPFMEIAHH